MRASIDLPTSNDSVSWAMIVALAAGVVTVEAVRPMAIEVRSLAGLILACAALCSAAGFYSRVRVNERFSTCCLGLAQALLFSALGSILSYLLARNSLPLRDSALAGWDQGLGLDWIAYARWVDTRAWLVPIYLVLVFFLTRRMLRQGED